MSGSHLRNLKKEDVWLQNKGVISEVETNHIPEACRNERSSLLLVDPADSERAPWCCFEVLSFHTGHTPGSSEEEKQQ